MFKILKIVVLFTFSFLLINSVYSYQSQNPREPRELVPYSLETDYLTIKNDVPEDKKGYNSNALYKQLRAYINSLEWSLLYDQEQRHEIHIKYDSDGDEFEFTIKNKKIESNFIRFI